MLRNREMTDGYCSFHVLKRDRNRSTFRIFFVYLWFFGQNSVSCWCECFKRTSSISDDERNGFLGTDAPNRAHLQGALQTLVTHRSARYSPAANWRLLKIQTLLRCKAELAHPTEILTYLHQVPVTFETVDAGLCWPSSCSWISFFFLASFKQPGHLHSSLGGSILHMILMCLLGMWVTLTSKSNNLPSMILPELSHWPFSKAQTWIQLEKFHPDSHLPQCLGVCK